MFIKNKTRFIILHNRILHIYKYYIISLKKNVKNKELIKKQLAFYKLLNVFILKYIYKELNQIQLNIKRIINVRKKEYLINFKFCVYKNFYISTKFLLI